mgnify:CR=1 FL=1|jgi:phosphotransferase system HPr (HPr) family protein
MMMKQTYTIVNPQGFHVRPTKVFVDKAITYPCDVFLISKNRRMNGKSSLGVMSLGLKKSDEVTLEVNGELEEEALAGLGEVLVSIHD